MRSERTVGTVAIHHQIADDLREDIDRGKLQPGDDLPSLRELQGRYGCSDGPVREAFAVLRREGRITSGRGKRAQVRQRPTPISLSLDWTQEQKRLVLRPAAERETRGAIELTAGLDMKDIDSEHKYLQATADPDLAREFDIEVGTPLVQRNYEMTHKRTGVRLAWSISYIPRALIEGNSRLLDEKEEPWPGGHQHQLYTVGIEIDRFVRTVSAVEPTPGDRQRWDMEPGVALLMVRSRSVDIDGRVVELSDAAYPADRTEIAFTEHLDRWPADYPRYRKGDL